jgi:acetyl esterase/lipase
MKRSVAVAAFGLTALAVRRYVAFRQSMSAVARELRTHALILMSVPLNALTLPFLRMAYRFRSDPGPNMTLTEHRVGNHSIKVLVLAPAGHSSARPAVLAIHGGGMCVGSAHLEVEPAGRIAQETGAVIVMPNYRLAPEHPYPAALDDCITTLHWMRSHADEFGIDIDRIAVFGPSAGGGLAAAVAQRSIDEGIPLRAQALVYPMLDDRTVLRDDHAGRGELTWSPASNRFAWTAYLGRVPRIADAPTYAAPARRADLTGLPPAWIGVGDLDLFYEEDITYAERLKSAGVPCELVAVTGMYHTADGLMRKTQSMQDFHASMVQFLRVHLEAAPISA